MFPSLRSVAFIAGFAGFAANILPAGAQADRGSLAGSVTETTKAVLQGAQVVLEPGGRTAVTDQEGSFVLAGIKPGRYTVTVSYLGFQQYQTEVDITAGAITHADAMLSVGNASSDVEVRPEREVGEAEALNRQRVSANIVQVLPSEVINSLPNVNIADAAGRLPSVSLERDEGEGKYVQIRGTEPRLNDVTIDGVQVPSPESARYVKLDTLPADIVESLELYKTLTAHMDADGIGGTLNLITRQATDEPYFAVEGLFGHNPINGVRSNNQEFATYGHRFLAGKKLGILATGSYDYNGRGINDVEPGEGVNSLPNGQTYNGPNTIDLRNYFYDRSRFGGGGTLDYKFSDQLSVFVRGLYSLLKDYGEDSITTLNAGNFLTPSTTDQTGSSGYQDLYRRPLQQIWSVNASGDKRFGTSKLHALAALSQAKFTGGFNDARFNGLGPTTTGTGENAVTNQDGVAFNTASSNPSLPKFNVTALPNNQSVFDPAVNVLSEIDFQNNSTFERDAVGQIDYSRGYTLGSNFGTWEAGFKVRDAHKSQIYSEPIASPSVNLTAAQFPSSRGAGASYYFGQYQPGPQVQFTNLLSYYNANATQFTLDPNTARNLRGDFTVDERVFAGYLENTITHGRYRFNTGVRVESTNDDTLGYRQNGTDAAAAVAGNNNYMYVLPSAGVQYNLSNYTDFRAAFSLGLARPNYQDITPYQTYNPSSEGNASDPKLAAGNPALRPTWSENIDLLGEHYLKSVGVVQGGVFYKQTFNDIFNSVVPVSFLVPNMTQSTTLLEAIPANSPSAHLIGVEGSWEQHLTNLPGALSGTGFRFNYSYVTSVAEVPGRSDHPALQRNAPNNWNVDLTYDKYGLSTRMGLTHNDANIAAYQYQDGTPIAGSPTTVTPGGLHGPNGDNYFYPHTQVDAQVNYIVPKGRGISIVAQFLNLNNEVFGFYNGSERYPVQREYYSPTYTFGLRWTSSAERGSVFHQ